MPVHACLCLFRRHHYTEDEEEADEDEDEDQGNDEDKSDENEKAPPTPRGIIRKAAILLLIGTAACALFSDPMVEAVSAFSKVGQSLHTPLRGVAVQDFANHGT